MDRFIDRSSSTRTPPRRSGGGGGVHKPLIQFIDVSRRSKTTTDKRIRTDWELVNMTESKTLSTSLRLSAPKMRVIDSPLDSRGHTVCIVTSANNAKSSHKTIHLSVASNPTLNFPLIGESISRKARGGCPLKVP